MPIVAFCSLRNFCRTCKLSRNVLYEGQATYRPGVEHDHTSGTPQSRRRALLRRRHVLPTRGLDLQIPERIDRQMLEQAPPPRSAEAGHPARAPDLAARMRPRPWPQQGQGRPGSRHRNAGREMVIRPDARTQDPDSARGREIAPSAMSRAKSSRLLRAARSASIRRQSPSRSADQPGRALCKEPPLLSTKWDKS